MKKTLFFLLFAAFSMTVWGAKGPGFGDRRYTLTAMGEYSYNTTWSHHGNLDLQALLPFNPHFEMEARLQLSTANVYSGALQFRPKFELPVGEMFIETDIYYRALLRSRSNDITAALGVGYRMDHVSVTLGVFGRVIEVFCRPQNNNWNLSFMFSNIDDYQMERMWQPLFGIGAWVDVKEHWRLNFGAQCKPTGMFHLDASFYGATARAGFSYRF